jgi:hypothetical protein
LYLIVHCFFCFVLSFKQILILFLKITSTPQALASAAPVNPDAVREFIRQLSARASQSVAGGGGGGVDVGGGGIGPEEQMDIATTEHSPNIQALQVI